TKPLHGSPLPSVPVERSGSSPCRQSSPPTSSPPFRPADRASPAHSSPFTREPTMAGAITAPAIVGETICEAVDLHPGQRVLDVAAGAGNAAVAAARRFCDVTASDYVPALLELGRERAAGERLPVTF